MSQLFTLHLARLNCVCVAKASNGEQRSALGVTFGAMLIHILTPRCSVTKMTKGLALQALLMTHCPERAAAA